MKKLFAVACLLGALLLPGAARPGAEILKVGVFDMQRIMRESKTITAYRQRLGSEFEAKGKLFQAQQGAARKMEEKLKSEGQKLPPGERGQLEERLATAMRDLKRLKEDLDLEIQKKDRELSQKAVAEIGEVVRDMAKREKYTLVFERNAAGIVHFTDAVDITQKVIGAYDTKKGK
ncbi:MAG: OmpH family outer membrane protein [Alphaproteobacteria bacterium]|uniref:OmpH family outer membrane protein n=1 Tax=Candidatus Nitrobium versatile TaxID=2884831 RepID=A0A953J769_9BACT|nr:OmpH family outer membrane protein [Candidatus Nitrobium versatile]